MACNTDLLEFVVVFDLSTRHRSVQRHCSLLLIPVEEGFLVRYSVLLIFIFFVRLISTIKSCSSRYYVFLTLGVSGLTIPAPTLVKLKCRTHFHVSTLSLTFITFAQLISRHGTARMGSSLTNKAFGVSGQRALDIVITPIQSVVGGWEYKRAAPR